VRTETSILLPAARVDLFLKDKATIESARMLSTDWRFARVTVNVFEGDVETAIRAYSGGKSPDMILVETDTTNEVFISRLGELSGRCDEGTSAIVIGPVNDVNLYRSLTAMGVSDYLVFPVPVDTLSEVIAVTLIEKLGTAGSRLIAMVGSKGGVGVSALAQALAWGIADSLGQKTFLFDAAGGWTSLGVGMGFEPTAGTGEVIRAATNKDMDSFRRTLFNPTDKISVLGTGAELLLEHNAQPQSFEEILNVAMASYPVVIADLSGAPSAIKKMILSRAHEIIVVTTPVLSSLRLARSLMQEIKKTAGGHHPSIDLVINMTGIAPGKEVSKGDIASAMDAAPSVFIPYDSRLFIGAEAEAQKLSSYKGGDSIVQSLLPLVEKMVKNNGGQSNHSSGTVGGLLSRLVRR
jgi:pilus assembly protein CpaE